MMNFSKFLQSLIHWEHGRIWDCVYLEYPPLHLLLPPLHGGHPALDKSFSLCVLNRILCAYMKLHSLTVPSLWIMNMPFLTRHFQNLKYINFLKSLPDPTSFPTTSYCPISWLPFTSKMLAISWESLQTTKYWRRCGGKGTFVHC